MYEDYGYKLLEYKTYEQKKKIKHKSSYFQGIKGQYKIKKIDTNSNLIKEDYKTQQSKKINIISEKIDKFNYTTNYMSQSNLKENDLKINEKSNDSNVEKDFQKITRFQKLFSKYSDLPTDDINLIQTSETSYEIKENNILQKSLNEWSEINYDNFKCNRNEEINLD